MIEAPQRTMGDTNWFVQARFGLFIHWGIYYYTQQAQNTTMGGMPPGTLTLKLPVQKPPVSAPVVEIFLKE